MIEINLFDRSFVGQPCSVATQTPRTMRYVRDQMQWDGVTVFTGSMLFDPIVDDVQSRYKIGWLNGDARCLRPEQYDEHWKVAHKFDAIMTHDAYLLKSGGWHFDTPQHATVKHVPYIKTIRGGSWVALDQWGMYPKSKNVSMILSEKTQLPGHQLRHAIADAGLPIDMYGPAYTPIGHDKALAYRDYRFAVVVEACQEDNWFTEHLIDALAFGCVPIYWGCENIAEYFNIASFMAFQDMAALIEILNICTTSAYDAMRSPLRIDQRRAKQYAITEDWQIAHCLRPYLE
jgi:hypothetical protein